jgi:pSer/pThr/pTyr-binding forkhead associated (FHA) protein
MQRPTKPFLGTSSTISPTDSPLAARNGNLKNNNGILKSEKKGFLHCFHLTDGEWKSQQFGSAVDSISIGPPSPTNNIKINGEHIDNPHLHAKRFNEAWYLMEVGKSDLTKANGIPVRQKVIPMNESALITIEDEKLVFIHSETEGGKPSLLAGTPEPTDFYFEDSKGEKYPIKTDKACLMGANPFCGFCTGTPHFLEKIAKPPDRSVFERDFLGIFFQFKSKLMFTALNDRLKINGVSATSPLIVPDACELSCGRTVLPLNEPEFLTGKGRILLPNKPSKPRLTLLPVSNPSGTLPNIEMSETTRSVTIGRSSRDADVVILEPALSRKHSQCVSYEKNIMVFDCGSSNGTFVNGEKITKKTIHPGDVVTFGNIDYFFCYAENHKKQAVRSTSAIESAPTTLKARHAS